MNEEVKELIDDLRFKWKKAGYHVYVEKENHMSSCNFTYTAYLTVFNLWKTYKNEYRSVIRKRIPSKTFSVRVNQNDPPETTEVKLLTLKEKVQEFISKL
jgi:hypothetical protein